MNDQVFLSYAREDYASAKRLYDELTANKVAVWFDEVCLAPGAKWKIEILKAIRSSRYFCSVLSSNSVSRMGFVQTEIREGLDVLDKYPDDEVYIIPVRLNECQPSHEKLQELNWVDLYPSWEKGMFRLLRFLAHPVLRFDGIYISDDGGTVRILRFFSNGDVVARLFNEGAPVKRIPHDALKEKEAIRGVYTIKGTALTFTTTNQAGEVDYSGEIQVNCLLMRFHSRINGNRGFWEFAFSTDR